MKNNPYDENLLCGLAGMDPSASPQAATNDTDDDSLSSVDSSPPGSDYSSAEESDADDIAPPRKSAKQEGSKNGQCTVSLVGKGLQTIVVHAVPTPYAGSDWGGGASDGDSLPTSAWRGVRGMIRGKIVVHEMANRDSEKTIDFCLEYVPADPAAVTGTRAGAGPVAGFNERPSKSGRGPSDAGSAGLGHGLRWAIRVGAML